MKTKQKLFLFALVFGLIGILPSIIKPEAANASDTCVDSDGGAKYFNKGIIHYKEYDANGNITTTSDHEDACTDAIIGGIFKQNTLREYYCDANNKVQYDQYICPDGCNDGACKRSGINRPDLIVESARINLPHFLMVTAYFGIKPYTFNC